MSDDNSQPQNAPIPLQEAMDMLFDRIRSLEIARTEFQASIQGQHLATKTLLRNIAERYGLSPQEWIAAVSSTAEDIANMAKAAEVDDPAVADRFREIEQYIRDWWVDSDEPINRRDGFSVIIGGKSE